MLFSTTCMALILHLMSTCSELGGDAFAFGPGVARRSPSSSSLSFLNQHQRQEQRQQSSLLFAISTQWQAATTTDTSSSSISTFPAYNAPLPPPPAVRSGNNGPLKSGTTMSSSSTAVSYKHLFRHVEDISMDCWLRVTEAREFLQSVGYTNEEMDKLAREYPKLLTLSVHDALGPKIRFLVTSMGGGTGGQLEWIDGGDIEQETERNAASPSSSSPSRSLGELPSDDECRIDYDFEAVHHSLRLYPETRRLVPASFFAQRLEKMLAPRHAYLQFFKLPSTANDLIYFLQGQRFQQFLNEGCNASSQTSAADFATLCTKWASRHLPPMGGSLTHLEVLHTAETVRAMERAFAGGLLLAAKNVPTADLKLLDMTPGQLVELLVSHGANTMETDSHGVSLLHWAAGTGNLVGLQALLRQEVDMTASLLHDDNEQDVPAITQVILLDDTTKDGSTPIHWAACGVGPTGFCAGGHADVCRYLLESVSSSTTSLATHEQEQTVDDKAVALANAETDIGTTPIMLAAWSGSLETVKVLIEYGKANPHATNAEGYNAAHFAASAGHLHVCQYLYEALGMDFVRAHVKPNETSNWSDSSTIDGDNRRKFTSPLQSAIAYDRKEVVEWIQKTFPGAAAFSS